MLSFLTTNIEIKVLVRSVENNIMEYKVSGTGGYQLAGKEEISRCSRLQYVMMNIFLQKN